MEFLTSSRDLGCLRLGLSASPEGGLPTSKRQKTAYLFNDERCLCVRNSLRSCILGVEIEKIFPRWDIV